METSKPDLSQKKHLSFSLRFRLFVLVLIAVLPALGLILYNGWGERRDARTEVRKETLSLTQLAVVQQEQVFEGSRQLMATIGTLAGSADLEAITQEQCGPLFAGLLQEFSFYSNVGIMTASGRVVCSAAPMTQIVNSADHAWFQSAVATRQLSVGDYEIDPITNKPAITVAYPIVAPNEQLNGLMFIALDLDWLDSQLSLATLPDGATFSIIDRDGTIVARQPHSAGSPGQPIAAPAMDLLQRGQGVANVHGVDGVTRVTAITPITGTVDTGLYASIGVPEATAFSAANDRLIRDLAGLGLAVLLALAAAWVGSEMFVLRQTRALVAATKKLAAGDLTARSSSSKGTGEMAELAGRFDDMAVSLEQRESYLRQTLQELKAVNESLESRVQVRTIGLTTANDALQSEIAERRRAEEELDRFFTMSIDMICIAGFDGYFKRLNPAWEQTLGFSTEELLARPYLELVHPEDREPTLAAAATQAEQGLDVYSFENRYLCKDGSYKWLLWSSTPLAEKQIMYAVARDITERKQAEQAIAEKARELERSNAELEDFTHVVSHDLKEPLRGIEAFSGFLDEDYGDKLDERGRGYVTVLQDSAVRMRDLIDDLLQLSRIGRIKPQYVAVSAGSLLRKIAEGMEFTLRDKNVELRIQEDLPQLVCDPVRVRQVFENLISNAVKYNDKQQPVIEIACSRTPDAYTFSVRDNGPGIDTKYHEKVFRIFQRLVRREEHEGTGVGLTICKKIVEGHGGKIWVESGDPGLGATFFFSIPTSIQLSNPAKEEQNGSGTAARSHPARGGQPSGRGDHEESPGQGPGEEPAHSGARRPGSP